MRSRVRAAIAVTTITTITTLLASCTDDPTPEPAEQHPTTSAPAGTLAAPSAQSLDDLIAELAPVEPVLSHVVPGLPDDGSGWRVSPEGTQLEKYRFAVGGVPVMGAGVRVLRYEDGSTRLVTALHAGKSFRARSQKPALDAVEAKQRALGAYAAHARGMVAAREADLAYDVRLSEPAADGARSLEYLRLTYRVQLDDPAGLTAVVDASDGKVLRLESGIVGATAQGRGRSQPSMTLQVEPNPGGGQCLTDLTRGSSIVNPNPCTLSLGPGLHTFVDLLNTPGPDVITRVTDTDGVFGNGLVGDGRVSVLTERERTTAADAHWGVGQTYDFFRAQYGRTLLGVGDLLSIVVASDGAPLWDAFYRWPQNAIFIAPRIPNSWLCSFLDPDCSIPAASLELMAHEYTHALLTAEIAIPSGPPVPPSEFGALHEGIADVFAVLADAWVYDGGATGPVVPPRGWWFGDTVWAQSWREFELPSLDGSGRDHWTPALFTELAGGVADVHDAGGIMRRAFFFLSEGVGPYSPGGTAQNTSSYLPEGMTGIGLTSAARLLYLTFVSQFNTGDQPNFHQMREGMVREAQFLTGRACAPLVKSTQDAWAAVNVGTKADRAEPAVNLQVVQIGSSARAYVYFYTPFEDPPALVQLLVDGAVRQASVPVSLDDDDGEGNAFYSASVDIPFSSLAPGAHTYRVEVSDSCENVGVDEVVYERDTQGPTHLEYTDLEYWKSTKRRFRVAAVDPHLAWFSLQVGSVASGPRFVLVGTNSLEIELDLPLNHGSTTLTLTAADKFGQQTTQSWTYVIDRQAPAVCAVSAVIVPNEPQSAQVTLYGYDPVTSPGSPIHILDIWLDNVPWWWVDRNQPVGSDRYMTRHGVPGGGSMTRKATGVLNGVHQFEGKCVDSWGNVRSVTDRFVVSPPPIITPIPTINTQTGAFTLKNSASSPYARVTFVEILEDGSPRSQLSCFSATCEVTYASTMAPGTTRTFVLRARDEEGRMTTVASAVTMPLPPAPLINSITPSGPAINPSFTVDATGTGLRVEVLKSGAVIGTDNSAPFVLPVNLAGWDTGTYTLTFRAVDTYGRVASATCDVFADSTPPLVSVTVSEADPPFRLNVEVLDHTQVAQVVLKEDGVTIATLTAPYVYWYSPQSPGAHQMTAEATDVYFNQTTYPFTGPADVTVPQVTLDFVTSGGPHSVVTVSDTCGIAYPGRIFLDGAQVGLFNASPYNHPWPSLSPGPHTVAVQVSDRCGNHRHVEQIVELVDDPP